MPRPPFVVIAVVGVCAGLLGVAGVSLGAVGYDDLMVQTPMPASLSVPAVREAKVPIGTPAPTLSTDDDGSVGPPPLVYGPGRDASDEPEDVWGPGL
jgi:hypothetical protein